LISCTVSAPLCNAPCRIGQAALPPRWSLTTQLNEDASRPVRRSSSLFGSASGVQSFTPKALSGSSISSDATVVRL
jgi:hypothetical protein